MAFDLLYMLALLGGLCLLFGVVYPVVAILCFPVYRLLGGRECLQDYIRCL